MLHFVLKDINPTKANSYSLFLKEMNEIAMLITVAGAPYVTHESIRVDENSGQNSFELSEGVFEVKFKGQLQDGQVVSAYFEVFEERKRLLEISYSIKEGSAIALRAKLNCEGEYLVREELERVFERDFSHEAHEYIDQPLEELRKPKSIADELLASSIELPPSFEEELSENNETGDAEETQEEAIEEEVKNDLEEVTEELSELSQKVQDALLEANRMIAILNDLSHDVTRGATVNFGEPKLKTELLDNGALVEMFDDETSPYKITFRRGSLDNMVEVSFFLEQDGVLIFSVYFSSEGIGRIASSSVQSEVILNKVKTNLL